MTKNQLIKKGNTLIKEFMKLQEAQIVDRADYDTRPWYHISLVNNLTMMPEEQFRYHVSWDWLMPVIEKIAKIPFHENGDHVDTAYPRTFGMLDEHGHHMFRFNRHAVFIRKKLIDAAFEAVIDFIEFYNKKHNGS